MLQPVVQALVITPVCVRVSFVTREEAGAKRREPFPTECVRHRRDDDGGGPSCLRHPGAVVWVSTAPGGCRPSVP